MNVHKKMAIRMGIYVVMIGYLLLDLFVFEGPIKKGLTGPAPDSPEAIAAAKAKGVVARVYAQPIYRAQIEGREKEYLWERGRKIEEVPLAERKLIRNIALQEMIDERLVKVQIKVSSPDEYEVSEEELDAAVERYKKRYADESALGKAIERQGWKGEKELRMRIAGRLQREKYFEKEIESEVEMSDEEARAWYDKHHEKLALPLRRHVRHIFVASLDHPEEEGQALIETARKRVVDGKEDFAKVAGELTEDLKSKKVGGDLGWLTKDRVMKGFTEQVFALPLKKPTIIRTMLGWHLVEVLEEKAKTARPYEEVVEEIKASLAVQVREEKISGYRGVLRHYAAGKIDIFYDVLYMGLEEKEATPEETEQKEEPNSEG